MILPALAVTKLTRHMTLSDINVRNSVVNRPPCELLFERASWRGERGESNIILPQRTRFLDGVSR